jgi:O-acetyl-ADP-ribose deacetylase (regulator of RNase III)
MQIEQDGILIECVQGNIADQPNIDVVVNAANAQLMSGGGVAGAIHTAAGPELAEECRALAPIQCGQAVITSGHDLPNQFVIHCLGPVYGQNRPEADLLAACYENALTLAEQHQLTSIAFPAISTGVFGYPVADAAQVAFGTVLAMAQHLSQLKLVRFVLYSHSDLETHQAMLNKLLEKETV